MPTLPFARARFSLTIGVTGGLILGAIGLSSPIAHAQTAVATVSATAAATSAPNVLFHDDFVTRANRWGLSPDPTPDNITYSAPDSTTHSALIFTLISPRMVLSTGPDSALMPDTFTLDMQADWKANNTTNNTLDKHSPRVGAILAEYDPRDFIAVTITRGGLVQIGHYQVNTWQDLITPKQTSLVNLSKLALHIVLSAPDVTSTDRQISVTINDTPVLTDTLGSYTASTFGIVAENGGSGSSTFSVQDFKISESPSK